MSEPKLEPEFTLEGNLDRAYNILLKLYFFQHLNNDWTIKIANYESDGISTTFLGRMYNILS